MIKKLIPASIKNEILTIITKEKPESTEQLITLIAEEYNLSKQEIIAILLELEEENKLNFTRMLPSTPTTVRAYLSSKKASWYSVVFVLAFTTTATVFLIPQEVYPTVYPRAFLAVVFVVLLPGYAFLKAMFPSGNVLGTDSPTMGFTEKSVLSIVISFILTSVTALILNFTPWGITLTSITICLLALTLVLSTVAIFREYERSLIEA